MEIKYGITDLDTIARKLLSEATTKTFLFYGEMGAGKTTLIKAMLEVLGAEDPGSSPTFSLVNEYSTPKGVVHHFDFYRIEDENEALDMGIEDYLAEDSWKFIEWPEKIEKFLWQERHKVEITTLEKGKRVLKFS